jgi:DNA-binding beta-propeller fold protein YncE
MSIHRRLVQGPVRSRLFGGAGHGVALGSRWAALRLAVVLAVLVCGGLVLGAGSAFGAFAYPFDGQLVPSSGEFGGLGPGSVAVDDENGDTYVADSSSGAVDVFETASGVELASLDGALTPAGSFSAAAVAANDGTGDVYVLDSGHSVVDIFEPSGGYAGQITGVETPAGAFNGPDAIAVDQATGEVYVLDGGNGVVDVFSAAGVYTGKQISLAPSGFGNYGPGLAVDDFNGDMYVSESDFDVVDVFDATGDYVTTWHGSNTPAGSFGGAYVSVAADNASGDVYVTDSLHRVTDVLEPSGEYVAQFSHSFREAQGTAVDQANGRVYVSNDSPGVVDILGPALVIPSVVTGSASEVGSRSATLSGTVDPDGIELKDCRFEYGTSTAYGQSAPCVPAASAIPVDSSEHAVSANITGLTAGSTYHFRLVAANENDLSEPNAGQDATLQTLPPPSIEDASTANLTGSSVDLDAQVNPNGLDTTYRFEYGTSTAYGTSVPVPDGDLGAGTSAVLVTTHLSGLTAGTTYHWQVVASNESGTTTTGDQTFVYIAGGGGLPDGREYELVTPAHRNASVVGQYATGYLAPDVAEDGSRVVMESVQCFAGSVSCVGVELTVGAPFAFTRTGGGWVATPLAPPASRFGLSSSWMFSADADTALFGSAGSFVARLSDGSFADVGPEVEFGNGSGDGRDYYPRATADMSHVVWESGGSSPEQVYEYVGSGNTAPISVGVSGGAGSTDLISECRTRLGAGGIIEKSVNALSADGSTVFFTAEACSSGTGANAGVPVPANTLYARIDQSRTVLVSGRSPLECTGACLLSPASDALYVRASDDGSKVFFESTQQLTNNASEGSGNLYEYDFDRPAGRNLVAVSAGDTSGGGPRVQGVMAISSDGSHIYFVAQGVLGGANGRGQLPVDGGENLYVFERDASYPGGHVAFIATLHGATNVLELAGAAAEVTPDGRFLVLASHAALTADDTSTTGAAQVFRYDAQTGELVRISVGEDGFNDNGNAGQGDARITSAEFSSRAGPPRSDPTMSNDGSYVFFTSPVGLTPGALNEAPLEGGGGVAENVYEWHEGRVYLISDGRDVGKAYNPCNSTELPSDVCLIGSDASGANVFFSSADQLTGQETGGQEEVYDARICTASEPCTQPAPQPVACQGEGCHGAPGGTPVLSAPGSVGFAGPGNLAPPAPVRTVTHKKKIAAKKHGKRKRQRKRTGKGKAGRRAARGSVKGGGGR